MIRRYGNHCVECNEGRGVQTRPPVSWRCRVLGMLGLFIVVSTAQEANAQIDQYTCYQGRDLNEPRFVPLAGVNLGDQIISEPVVINKPQFVCVPAATNGTPINDPGPLLGCYRIKSAALSPPVGVELNTQFQTSQFALTKGYMVCIPGVEVECSSCQFKISNPGVLGRCGSVWYDAEASGVRVSDEDGVANVTVNLLDNTGQFLQSATTDADGYYEFGALAAGTYEVQFIAPTGYAFSPANTTSDDADSDADPSTGRTGTFTVGPGAVPNHLDAGLIWPESTGGTGSIGDYVWFDADEDGAQDAGEYGLSGLQVNLLDSAGNFLRTTTTDDSGVYEFAVLAAGTYRVEFVAPSGNGFSPASAAGDAVDSDADPSTGRTGTIALAAGGSSPDIDAGLVASHDSDSSVGDFMWKDEDGDGLQDAGEPGVAGATVRLLDAAGSVIQVTATDANGGYALAGLAADQPYRLQFISPIPGTYEFTEAEAGSTDVDSDADLVGDTPFFQVGFGTADSTRDAGVKPVLCLCDCEAPPAPNLKTAKGWKEGNTIHWREVNANEHDSYKKENTKQKTSKWSESMEGEESVRTTPERPVVGGGPYYRTDQEWTKFKLCIEYKTLDNAPVGVKVSNERYGNSGIYIFDRWEVQIIDPSQFDLPGGGKGVKKNTQIRHDYRKNKVTPDPGPETKNPCETDDIVTKVSDQSQLTPGWFYKLRPENTDDSEFINRANPMGKWNKLQIEFTPPDATDPEDVEPACATVTLNGTVVFEDELIDEDGDPVTGTGMRAGKDGFPAKGPIYLQSHGGNQVAFKNPVITELP